MTYPECWPGTKVPRTSDNAFTCGHGEPIDWKPLSNSARMSKVHSKRIGSLVAKGENPGAIRGISKTADQRLALHPGSMS